MSAQWEELYAREAHRNRGAKAEIEQLHKSLDDAVKRAERAERTVQGLREATS